MRAHGGPRVALCLAVLCLDITVYAAQPPLIADHQSTVRDVIHHAGARAVFLAAYDSDQVLRIDADSGEVTARIATGDGRGGATVPLRIQSQAESSAPRRTRC